MGLGNILTSYERLLKRHFLVTQSVTGCILAVAGDVTCQLLFSQGSADSKEANPFDYGRTLRLGIYGLLVSGPLVCTWFRILEHFIKGNNYISSRIRIPRQALYKMVADQLLFAPLGTGLFFAVNGWMEGLNSEEIGDKIRSRFWPTLLISYQVWPLVQIINFSVVPYHLRPLFVNFVGLGWSTYMSFSNSLTLAAKSESYAAASASSTLLDK